MIEARVLKLLHKKINLGSEHVHLFKLVNLAGAGLSALLIPALVRGHFSTILRASSILRVKKEPLAAASICSRAERINP
jgi:hypothetical protein